MPSASSLFSCVCIALVRFVFTPPRRICNRCFMANKRYNSVVSVQFESESEVCSLDAGRFSWFERISMTIILLNCVTLGMYEPCADSAACVTVRCRILEAFDPRGVRPRHLRLLRGRDVRQGAGDGPRRKVHVPRRDLELSRHVHRHHRVRALRLSSRLLCRFFCFPLISGQLNVNVRDV